MTHADCRPVEVIALAFLAGALIGSAAALLVAPEPGQRMRRRLAHGAKTAQEELSGVAAETREAFGALTKDARQTLRQTASRLGAVVEATREALSGDVEPVPRGGSLRRIRNSRP
jgi:gas vesicle protein